MLLEIQEMYLHQLKNHYQLDDDQAIKWMTMKKILFMMFIILMKWL